MKTMKLGILTILSVVAVLSGGCSKPSGISDSISTTESFNLGITDSSGKSIASGHLQLPINIEDLGRFTGECDIKVSEVPQKPSSQDDHAIRCLSQNNGVCSGTVRDGVVRIELHPQVDDNTVYLEGKLNTQSFKGKCFYQSFAGYKAFGTFEAKIETKETP